MDFENELQEFRGVQNQYFDKNGNAYLKIIPHQLCERMLLLINQMETQIKSQDENVR